MLILLVTQSNFSFGHGSVQVKKKCRGLERKYVSRAWVTKTLIVANHYQSVATCNPCYPISYGGEAHAFLSNCAWQKARYCHGAILDGKVSKWFCNRGNNYNIIEQFGRYNLNFEYENSYEESSIQTGEIIFGSNQISIPSINGKLLTSGKGMETYLEVRIWVSDSSRNDTLYNDLNTIHYGKIGINDGELVKEGIFSNSNVSMLVNEFENSINISDLNLNIEITGKYRELLSDDYESDKEIVVEIITHGGGKNEKSFDMMIEQTNQGEEFDNINFGLQYIENDKINISFNPIENDKYKVRIYDINGSIVSEYNSFEYLNDGSVEILLEKTNFTKGIFLVTYEGTNNIFAKKMIIH